LAVSACILSLFEADVNSSIMVEGNKLRKINARRSVSGGMKKKQNNNKIVQVITSPLPPKNIKKHRTFSSANINL
jgi:hypothetical protein